MIIHDVEQNSEEWHRLRAGIPTTSEFSNLITPTGKASKSIDAYARTLAGEKFAGERVDPFFGNFWTDRGHELEPDAVSYYEFIRQVETIRAGFVTDDAGTVGCSPDRLVGDDGILEIKCLKGDTHIKAMEDIRINGQCPPDYMPQTQGQLLVCERQWCDLLFYHPLLPSIIMRQAPDGAVHGILVDQLALLAKRRDELFDMLNAQKEAA